LTPLLLYSLPAEGGRKLKWGFVRAYTTPPLLLFFVFGIARKGTKKKSGVKAPHSKFGVRRLDAAFVFCFPSDVYMRIMLMGQRSHHMDNRTIAQRLAAHARELDSQAGNLYRSRAYRNAVETVLRLDHPLEEVVAQHGRKGLAALPGIGVHLAYTIERLVRTGEFRTMTPETVPPHQRVNNLAGVGPALTELLLERLGVTTLAELETADRAGRLDQLGLSKRRLEKLRAALARRAALAPEGTPCSAGPGTSSR
jgi:hypothetical protein